MSDVRMQFNRNSRFARNLRNASAKKFESLIDKIGAAWAREAEALARQRLNIDGPSSGKRGNGRLAMSFSHRVLKSDDVPMRIQLLSNKDERALYALEYGAARHRIYPVNARLLVFPISRWPNFDEALWAQSQVMASARKRNRPGSNSSLKGAASKTATQTGKRNAKDKLVAFPVVNHPGNKPYRIVRDSKEHIKQKVLGGGFRG